MNRAEARVLVVGVGGIGCPACLVLAQAGIGVIGLCDDDVVDRTNLHRQILFADADAGRPKVDAAARALLAIAPRVALRLHPVRLLPDGAIDLVGQYDVVLEGADNYPSKFLIADACKLAGVPVVHASAVRWVATALAVSRQGRPCYRCLFEDVPPTAGESCADAGVMGPVVGLIAAAQADLALAMIDGQLVEGELVTFDGRTDALRRLRVSSRDDCPLCGHPSHIRHIDPRAYAQAACAD